MSIFKDSFKKYVKDQLSLRDEILDTGNPFGEQFAGGDGGPREKYDRLKSRNVRLQSGEEVTLSPGVFYNYTLNKQATLRMTSLTDYVDDVDLEVGDLQADIAGAGVGFERLKGATLSQNFILEGGVLSDYARNLDRNGDGVSERIVRSVDRPRESFPKPGLKTNLGYGDFALGADGNADGFGIVPMPGIVDATIRTKSAYGSLREAKVNFVCHNRRQLEVLEMLYMRPGYCVLLEWSWSPFINNKGRVVSELETVDTVTRGKIYTNDITQTEIYNAINLLKEKSCGNYDGLLGFIKNFGFQARPDGGYDCYTELISMNEILDSLKVPNVSNILASSNITPSEVSNELTNARNLGYYPTFNGLLGLMMGIRNYATWESNDIFIRNEFDNAYSDEFYKKYTDLYDENGDLSEKGEALESRLGAEWEWKDITLDTYLLNLLKEEGTNVKEVLKQKLGGISDDILNSFILRGSSRRGFTGPGEDYINKHHNKNYIRWDALCILINNSLIPKDEKSLNVTNIVPDRVTQDVTGKNIFDPLLYIPITQYSTNTGANIIDFSCDYNVCILPHQFQTADQDLVDILFGTSPQLEYFPLEYTAAAYGASRIFYNGDNVIDFNDDRIQYDLLTYEHKYRRIGSIFINIEMLVDIAERNRDNEDYTIGQFINDIWKEINRVCPNHNFVLTDDKNSNNSFIIDLPVDNSSLPEYDDLYTFIPFSNKNTLREFSLESQVPSKLSATIAIRAQDPRNIEDIDGVTFAAFNKSIKNRLFSVDTLTEENKFKNNINNRLRDMANRHNELINAIKTYSINFFYNMIVSYRNEPTSDNIIGILKEFQKNEAYRQTMIKEVRNTFTSVIPLSFNATLDGISGMIIGNIFKIQKDRLPKAYKNANIGFILFNEEQTITSGQDWTTRIGGKMIILNDDNTSKTQLGSSDNPSFWGEVISDEGSFLTEETQINIDTGESNTEETDSTQERASDIYQTQVGDTVYLKKLKLTGITHVDGVEVTGSIGYSFVRDTPEVNNERVRNNGQFLPDFIDNSWGAFDSWNDAGLGLGIVTDILRVEYLDAQASIKLSAYHKYNLVGSEDYKILFTITPIIEIDGIQYYKDVEIKLKGDNTLVTNIEVNDTTNIKEIWFKIRFGEISDKFYGGYVLREGDKNATDEAFRYDIITKNLTNDRLPYEGWMRADTLAHTAENALSMI